MGLRRYRVATIDHVGADVIAVEEVQGSGALNSEFKRYCISVKGRNLPKGESKSFHFNKNNVRKLEEISTVLGMEATIAFVFVDNQEGIKKARLIISELETFRKSSDDEQVKFINWHKDKEGFHIKFTQSRYQKHLDAIKAREDVIYIEFTLDEKLTEY
ncbi:hypothetical protein K6V43_04485 [Streptococcus suis]|nr:hypothetical protein [Streptococcus suis]